MSKYNHPVRLMFGLLAVTQSALLSSPAMADVTESRTMNFDMGLAKIDSTITQRVSGDKQHTDTDTRCEGFLLSMICGDMRGAEIVRLDKSLTWKLDPKKRSYVETAFATPEQIAAAKAQRDALIEQMKNCPRGGEPAGADTSKCDMTPPKIEVKKTDETATIAGHQARRSWIALTQTCNDKSTGDACEFVVRFDVWLTQDQIAGVAEERAFRTAYMKKMGLDEQTMASAPQLQQYLAPYANALKQVGAKAGDLKGFPLKTVVSVSVGGERCAAAKRKEQQQGGSITANASDAAASAAASSSSAAAGSAAQEAITKSSNGSVMGTIAGSAAGAFGRSIVGGLFAKKKSQQQATQETAAAPTGDAGHVTVLSMTTETTAISSDAVPAEQFEIPAGWKLVQPKRQKEHEAPQCPKAGA